MKSRDLKIVYTDVFDEVDIKLTPFGEINENGEIMGVTIFKSGQTPMTFNLSIENLNNLMNMLNDVNSDIITNNILATQDAIFISYLLKSKLENKLECIKISKNDLIENNLYNIDIIFNDNSNPLHYVLRYVFPEDGYYFPFLPNDVKYEVNL